MAGRHTILALLLLSSTAFGLVDDVIEVLKFGKEIGEDILNSWDVLGKPFNASGGVALPVIRRSEKKVLAQLSLVYRAIEKVQAEVEKTNAAMRFLARVGFQGTKQDLRLQQMSRLLSKVAAADARMREYVHLQSDLERSTLEDFVKWCVSHDDGALPDILAEIHALISPPHNHLLGSSLFGLILEDAKNEHPDLCELQMSPHQLIYDMYNTISLTEIKGYAMMQFSWMLLRVYGKGNFTQEANLTRQRYGQRTNQTAAAARSALALAKRSVYRCDPEKYIAGVNYAEVTRLLQGYIENEVDMNSEKTCKQNCAYYTVAKNHGCYADQFCNKQETCRGRIIDCQYVDSDMWVCPSNTNGHRRYDWIEYESGRILGKNNVGQCKRGTTKVDSWWKLNLLHCSYCFCLCEDDPDSSERFFSMAEALADVENNKVVTGLRLVKYGRVFHLEITQGTIGERGAITPGSTVPLRKFDPSEKDVSQGVDYHMLTYENRAIDLDELDSPAGHVLTGVRFRLRGAHLHFEIRSTPFNYATGRLHYDKSQWVENENTEGTSNPRKKLELDKPDIPIRSSTSLPVDSSHDQYLEFTHTDYDADAAQSTVPFVDIQNVQPMKGASLISGAGIIHRGAKGSGGFIAVKLITYDFSKHVQAETPKETPSYNTDDDTTDFVPMVN